MGPVFNMNLRNVQMLFENLISYGFGRILISNVLKRTYLYGVFRLLCYGIFTYQISNWFVLVCMFLAAVYVN